MGPRNEANSPFDYFSEIRYKIAACAQRDYVLSKHMFERGLRNLLELLILSRNGQLDWNHVVSCQASQAQL